MMKFYQENKVNPFASCLPLLAQIPVFLALFYMLRSDLKVDICGRPPNTEAFDKAVQAAGSINDVACNNVVPGSAEFLFIPDLTWRATGTVLIVMLLLYVGTQVLSSYLMMMTSTMDKNQQRIMLVLPLLFVPFIQSFPAGLVLYWITTNAWTIVQQYIVRRAVGPPKPLEPAVAGAPAVAAAGGGGGSSGGTRRKGGGGSAKDEPSAAPAATRAKPSGPPPSSPRKKSRKRSGRRR
jgi:YidC/Oxa1 family membrane protein insertase